MDETPSPAPPPRGSVDPRGAARRRRYRRRRVVVVALALLVLGAPAWYVVNAFPIGSPGAPVVFQITDGEPIGQVIATMAGKGIVGSEFAFRLDLALTGAPTVQPGWYSLPTSLSFSAAKAALASGPNAEVLTTITSEATWEITTDLAGAMGQGFAHKFESYVHNGTVASPFQPTPHTSLEGLLAPGTYVLVPGETPKTLLAQMVARFITRAASVGLLPSTTLHGLDAYQLITAASIVEKEGYYAVNMPKTATVVFNRLARGTPLQMDSTVEYALHQDGGPVTQATEQIRSPYNTYLNLGLTPSPICIPSTQALNAILHAPRGPWLYFVVVTASGRMAFSSTYAEQQANERLAARRGLS
jgi:UPF0755 protein